MTESMSVMGRFYFRKTTEGNLIGEYSHRDCIRSFAEAASRTEKGSDWLGDYKTCWVEPPGFRFNKAHLTISLKEGSASLYTLLWLPWRGRGEPLFRGEAMISDDLLIGDYSDTEQ